jgi:hypothetical protein
LCVHVQFRERARCGAAGGAARGGAARKLGDREPPIPAGGRGALVLGGCALRHRGGLNCCRGEPERSGGNIAGGVDLRTRPLGVSKRRSGGCTAGGVDRRKRPLGASMRRAGGCCWLEPSRQRTRRAGAPRSEVGAGRRSITRRRGVSDGCARRTRDAKSDGVRAMRGTRTLSP